MFGAQGSGLPPKSQWNRILKLLMFAGEELTSTYGLVLRLKANEIAGEEFRLELAEQFSRLLETLNYLKGLARLPLSYPRLCEELLPLSFGQQLKAQAQRGFEPLNTMTVKEQVLRSTQSKLSHLVKSFNEFGRPGFFAQVHEVWLKDGQAAELSVRYPDLTTVLKNDFSGLTAFHKAIATLVRQDFDAAVIEQIQNLFIEACDGEIEACNIEELQQICAQVQGVSVVPAIEFPGQQQLIVRLKADWQTCDYDFAPVIRSKIANNGIEFFLTCLIRGECALLDFLPENLRVASDGRIFVRSAKLLQRLSHETCDILQAFVKAFAANDELAQRQAIHRLFVTDSMSAQLLEEITQFGLFLSRHLLAQSASKKVSFQHFREQSIDCLQGLGAAVIKDLWSGHAIRVAHPDFWSVAIAAFGLVELLLTLEADFSTVELAAN